MHGRLRGFLDGGDADAAAARAALRLRAGYRAENCLAAGDEDSDPPLAQRVAAAGERWGGRDGTAAAVAAEEEAAVMLGRGGRRVWPDSD